MKFQINRTEIKGAIAAVSKVLSASKTIASNAAVPMALVFGEGGTVLRASSDAFSCAVPLSTVELVGKNDLEEIDLGGAKGSAVGIIDYKGLASLLTKMKGESVIFSFPTKSSEMTIENEDLSASYLFPTAFPTAIIANLRTDSDKEKRCEVPMEQFDGIAESLKKAGSLASESRMNPAFSAVSVMFRGGDARLQVAAASNTEGFLVAYNHRINEIAEETHTALIPRACAQMVQAFFGSVVASKKKASTKNEAEANGEGAGVAAGSNESVEISMAASKNNSGACRAVFFETSGGAELSIACLEENTRMHEAIDGISTEAMSSSSLSLVIEKTALSSSFARLGAVFPDKANGLLAIEVFSGGSMKIEAKAGATASGKARATETLEVETESEDGVISMKSAVRLGTAEKIVKTFPQNFKGGIAKGKGNPLDTRFVFWEEGFEIPSTSPNAPKEGFPRTIAVQQSLCRL